MKFTIHSISANDLTVSSSGEATPTTPMNTDKQTLEVNGSSLSNLEGHDNALHVS